MGLKQQLELARQPGVNKPVGRGGKTPNQAQILANQAAFNVMKANGKEGEKRYKAEKEKERKNKIREIIDGDSEIIVNSREELLDLLSVATNVSVAKFNSEQEYYLISSWFLKELGIEDVKMSENNSGWALTYIHNKHSILITIAKRMGIEIPERKVIIHGSKS